MPFFSSFIFFPTLGATLLSFLFLGIIFFFYQFSSDPFRRSPITKTCYSLISLYPWIPLLSRPRTATHAHHSNPHAIILHSPPWTRPRFSRSLQRFRSDWNHSTSGTPQHSCSQTSAVVSEVFGAFQKACDSSDFLRIRFVSFGGALAMRKIWEGEIFSFFWV